MEHTPAKTQETYQPTSAITGFCNKLDKRYNLNSYKRELNKAS